MGTTTNVNPTPLDETGWRLTFFDGFDGVMLDRAAWPVVVHGLPYSTGAFEWRQEAVAVWDGELIISARSTPEGWIAGGVNQGWNGQLYGRYEVRARLDEGQGTSAAILLWPNSGDYPPEIDMMEAPDRDRSRTFVSLHGDDGFESRWVASDASEWHTYAVDWLPDRVTFYIDGKPIWETTSRVPQEPMGLGFIGVVATADEEWFGGGPDATTPGQVNLHVDWVRIWTPEELHPGNLPGVQYTLPPPPPSPAPAAVPPVHGDAPAAPGTAAPALPDIVREGIRSLGEDRYAASWNAAEWGTVPAVHIAPAAWADGMAQRLLLANYPTQHIDLRTAASRDLEVMAIGARDGSITTASGDDVVTWVAHTEAGAPDATFRISTGEGDDRVVVTAPSETWFDQPFAWGALWNGDYGGARSVALVDAGAGDDLVTAEGSVRLNAQGGAGRDTIIGGAGNDTIDGGAGDDWLTGGGGADLFVFAPGHGADRITDFRSGQDRLQFTGGIAAEDLTYTNTTLLDGSEGLMVGTGTGLIFLTGVSSLRPGDMLFG